MSHLIYNVKTLVYVVPFSIIIVVYFSITIYTLSFFSSSNIVVVTTELTAKLIHLLTVL